MTRQRVSKSAATVAIAVALAASGLRGAQPTKTKPELTEQQARTFATTAATAAKGDPKKFDKAFGEAVRTILWGYRDNTIYAGGWVGLPVRVIGPIAKYQRSVSDAIRRAEPFDGVAWHTTVSVVIDPTTIDSPNVEKVILTRDGVTIPPIKIALAPTEKTTLMGAKFTINAGMVDFPLEAFEPNAKVVLTVIPVAGSNSKWTFARLELQNISGQRD